jgi:RNA polymerase sigma-70 factor (ECF subfamily)
VYSIAFRILGDRGAAEEVAQDVFLALYRDLDRLQSQEHLLAWLRRVTVHRATDACRRRASRVDFAADEFCEENTHFGIGFAVSPGAFKPANMPTSIEQMVASLPPAQRAVVLLRYQEDLMPTEISALLSMPLGTVKSHLQRALKLLRSKASRQRKEVVHG